MIGETVGSYRIQTKLGEGGMGVVYIAEHPLLRKKAVVKFLHAELSGRADIVERFFNEARSATLIHHPGIVDVFDFGHHASGCAFILMEFLDGESVADRLRKGPFDAATAIVVGRQIASALGAAHASQIVHRDLKPDNVFLVRDAEAVGSARVKVLDFGIAKLAGDTAGAVKTQTGAVMGTPSYMAPEQCRSAGQVDHRADIYALGCILFEMVCGRPPFRTESLGQLIAAHMFEAPVPPSSLAWVPADLEAVILRALSKKPEDRQQSMSEVSAQLAACASTGSADVWGKVAMTAPPAPVASLGLAPTGTVDPTLRGAVAAIDPGLNAMTMQPEPVHRTTLGGSTGELVDRRAKPRRRVWFAATTALVLGGGGLVAWQLSDSSPGTHVASTPPSDATADAVATAPPAPPRPDAAANVTIVIESDPAGASVYRQSDGVLVGTTRYERSSPPLAGSLIFKVTREGYEDALVELATDHDDSRKVTLKPKARKSSTGGKPPPPVAPPPNEPKPCPPGMLCPK